MAQWAHTGATRLATALHAGEVSSRELLDLYLRRVEERAGFGFRRFANYRIRALLYAGKPNWTLLATLTPR